MRIKKNKLIAIAITTLVAIKTIVLFPYFTDGDLDVYNNLYDLVKNSNIADGYIAYTANINSAEIFHYLLIWISSNIGLLRIAFLAVSNALLAYLGFRILYNNKNYLIISILLLFNVYADVFYFSAERLKFSIIILLIALEHKSAIIKLLLVICAVATHVQSVLLIMIFNLIKPNANLIVKDERSSIKKILIIGLILVPIGFSQIADHAISKVIAYNADYGGVIPYKTIILSMTLLLVAPRKLGAVLASIISVVTALYVGDGRINFILYFILLIVSIQGSGNLKRGVALMLALYGAYQDISFVDNVISLGSGFKVDGGI